VSSIFIQVENEFKSFWFLLWWWKIAHFSIFFINRQRSVCLVSKVHGGNFPEFVPLLCQVPFSDSTAISKKKLPKMQMLPIGWFTVFLTLSRKFPTLLIKRSKKI
jgi:hypothetical protein